MTNSRQHPDYPNLTYAGVHYCRENGMDPAKMNRSAAPPLKKPWALFAGLIYYPNGGVRDLISMHATKEEAERAMDKQQVAGADGWWMEIVDLQKIIDTGEKP